MTDGNTYVINRHLAKREEYDAWQEGRDAIEALADAQDRIEELEAATPRAYRMGLEDAAKSAISLGEVLQSKWRAKKKADTYLEGMADACHDYAYAIRAIPTPTDLVERATKETGQ